MLGIRVKWPRWAFNRLLDVSSKDFATPPEITDEAGMYRHHLVVLCQRFRRARFHCLDDEIAEGPAWDIILLMYERHLRREATSFSDVLAPHMGSDNTAWRFWRLLETTDRIKKHYSGANEFIGHYQLSVQLISAMDLYFDSALEGPPDNYIQADEKIDD